MAARGNWPLTLNALYNAVQFGWIWPNVSFATASVILYHAWFPFCATLLGFVLCVRLLRFPEGEIRRLDAPERGGRVALPTCETHYEWLEPEGPPMGVVVVVHGFSGDAADVRPLAAELRKAGYRALVYDLVGRGHSGCRDALHTAPLFVSQLSELAIALKLPDAFHVVGNSLGGGVAVEFAKFFPDRVSTLTLVAPVGLRLASRAHVLTRIPLVPEIMFRCFLRSTVLAGLEYEWHDVADPKFAKMVESYEDRVVREPAFGRSLLSTARNFPFEELQDAYAAAGASRRPTLVVWGTGDRTCPASTAAEIKARYVPQAEVVLIRKGRHCVYTEFVGETANAIVGFLRRQEGRE
mmetsp:Transcript_29262/g.90534  ORF Transcript_29262/g.90534 Transcript_29262/m.90534 type:complete len:353 (-) Transcript_29262:27-1085(-)